MTIEKNCVRCLFETYVKGFEGIEKCKAWSLHGFFSIKKLLSDSENKNVDVVFPTEAVYDAVVFMMKHDPENKKTTYFLVRNSNEMNLYEINSIECETRCESRTEEREINQWGDSKHTKTNHDDPNFSDTAIEKSEDMQRFYHTSVLDLAKRYC